MMKLEIVYLDPHDLTPYENNTRKHSPEDIEQIKASIQADGFNDPIGVWGEKNLIVEGHGRQIAAIEMGLDKVPCIRLDHMTETQRRDYAIRHNRTAELSGWDFAKLEEEIAALEIEGVDLSGLKFELDALSGEGDEKTDKSVPLKENYQLIVDCENEDDMQEKYDILQEAGIDCRISTL
jgi:ParB-like chromosome segregation protein Spo0J